MEVLPEDLLKIVDEYYRSPTGLPDDIIDLINEYHNKREEEAVYKQFTQKEDKGAIPYLLRDDPVSKLPSDIQKMIGSYLPPVDYPSLVTTGKLSKLPDFTDEELEIINEPWSIGKAARAHEHPRLYPIIREAIARGMDFGYEGMSDVFGLAIEKEDYPTALLIAKRYPSIFSRSLLDVGFYLEKDLYQKGIPDISRLKNAKLSQEIKELLNIYRRQFEFLIDHYRPNLKVDSTDPVDGVLNLLVKLGWFDLVIKLAHKYQIPSTEYLSIIATRPELENEFLYQLKHLPKEDLPEYEETLYLIADEVPDRERYLVILQEARMNPDLINRVASKDVFPKDPLAQIHQQMNRKY